MTAYHPATEQHRLDREAAQRRLCQAADMAALFATRAALFKTRMGTHTARIQWPGVLEVLESKTGRLIAASVPGNPSKLERWAVNQPEGKQTARRLLTEAAQLAEAFATEKPLFERRHGTGKQAVTVRLTYPGALGVFDTTTGLPLALSLPGQPTALAAWRGAAGWRGEPYNAPHGGTGL